MVYPFDMVSRHELDFDKTSFLDIPMRCLNSDVLKFLLLRSFNLHSLRISFPYREND